MAVPSDARSVRSPGTISQWSCARLSRRLLARARARTFTPRVTSARATADPRKPVAPVTRTQSTACRAVLIGRSLDRPLPCRQPRQEEKRSRQGRNGARTNQPRIVIGKSAIVLLEAEGHEIANPDLDWRDSLGGRRGEVAVLAGADRKSTRLNSSHV